MIDLRVMKKPDLGFFIHLMDMVGWGMTPGDYDRILGFSPEGCFIAEEDNKELGMVAYCGIMEKSLGSETSLYSRDPRQRSRRQVDATRRGLSCLNGHQRPSRLDGVPIGDRPLSSPRIQGRILEPQILRSSSKAPRDDVLTNAERRLG